MTGMNPDELFAAACRLSVARRMALVARLLETIPITGNGLSLDDAELLEELDRRWSDDEGAVPWEQLRAEAG